MLARIFRRSLGLAAALLLVARHVAAQASATLPPGDPAHLDLARLRALGLVDSLVAGQRPVSRATVDRAIREAGARLRARVAAGDASLADAAQAILTRLAWEGTPSVPLVHRAFAEVTSLDGAPRRILVDNGLGGIDAFLNPPVGDRAGLAYGNGTTSSLESAHEWTPNRALAFVLQPRASYGPPLRDGSTGATGSIERAFVRAALGNLSVQVGRDHLAWGQGRGGGSLFATGGPALDMVLVGHERPLVLPWVLRLLGPTQLSLAVARLDGAQNFPNPYVVAYKASILPAGWLELGAMAYTKGGGRGAPGASFADRVLDATQLFDVVFRGDDDYQFSDKYAGVDFRLRAVPVGAELYGELLFNDLDFRRFGSSMTEDASHVLGIWFPRLDGAGRVDGSVEVRHTGIRQFRHHQFTSGQVVRGRLLGDPLGPDARGAYLSVGWRPSTWRALALEIAAEERRADEYTDVTGGARTIDFERVLARPRERRWRGVASWSSAFRGGAGRVRLDGGIERTLDWANVAGEHRTGGLGRVSVELRAWPR